MDLDSISTWRVRLATRIALSRISTGKLRLPACFVIGVLLMQRKRKR